jgi:hypothetical protein
MMSYARSADCPIRIPMATSYNQIITAVACIKRDGGNPTRSKQYRGTMPQPVADNRLETTMEPSIPNLNDRINDQKTEPRIAALKRFLDRLLSQPQAAARVDDEDRQTAHELGLTGPRSAAGAASPPATALTALTAGTSGAQAGDVDHAQLVELTRRAIRDEEPVRVADQSLETMSAPPAQPAAVP